MSKEHLEVVKEHFEMKYYDFDNLIRNLIPRYEEMHDLVVDQIDFSPGTPITVLDLGVGTGQTSLQILQR